MAVLVDVPSARCAPLPVDTSLWHRIRKRGQQDERRGFRVAGGVRFRKSARSVEYEPAARLGPERGADFLRAHRRAESVASVQHRRQGLCALTSCQVKLQAHGASNFPQVDFGTTSRVRPAMRNVQPQTLGATVKLSPSAGHIGTSQKRDSGTTKARSNGSSCGALLSPQCIHGRNTGCADGRNNGGEKCADGERTRSQGQRKWVPTGNTV